MVAAYGPLTWFGEFLNLKSNLKCYLELKEDAIDTCDEQAWEVRGDAIGDENARGCIEMRRHDSYLRVCIDSGTRD
jgi:hypothetical protein